MNKIQKFRELLAEQGIEMTIEEAKKAFKSADRFIKRSKKISMIDLWEMQKTKVDEVSKEEKDQLINLYKKAKEI